MIATALSFLAGILLIQQLPVLPTANYLIIVIIIASIMAWLRYWRCLFFLLGMLWASVFALERLSEQLAVELEGVEIPVIGVIASLPKYEERRISFDFIVTDAKQELPSKIKLSWYQTDTLVKAGQQWAFTVKLKRPHANLNPHGFDYERQLFIEGVGATGYVRSQVKPILLNAKATGFVFVHWRQTIIDGFNQILANKTSLPLIKALTIGDGSTLSKQQWEVFRDTGTTHLVVISGSHIGLIAGLIYLLVSRLWAWTGVLTWSPPKVAAIVALSVGVFYSALAGFSVPTQRAVIMLAVAMSAILLQRHTQPMQVLATALFAVLVIDPLAVLASGFWLSFLAVALIIYTVSGRLGKLNLIWESIKLNAVMALALAPLTLLFFQQMALVSPIANLLAAPLISLVIVPFALLAVVLMFVHQGLAVYVFTVVDWLLQNLWQVLNYLATLHYASLHHAQPSILAFILALFAVLILLAPKGMPVRWLGLVLLLPITFSDKQQLAKGELKLTLLDVGQGLAIVVQTAEHTLVYDTGAKFSADSDQGKNVVLPFLQAEGINRLDTLLISHSDNDHIGGAESVLHAMPTHKIISSVPNELTDYHASACVAGQTWSWDGIQFNILSPATHLVSENDNSCVLQIKTQQGNILLTGDIEAYAESWLVNNYGSQLKSKLLIAPHHGSKTSSSLGFLQVVQPETVLIPAGYRNQFGHPHAEVLARYQTLHAHYLNNADSGAITVSLQQGIWQVERFRQSHRHYWHTFFD